MLVRNRVSHIQRTTICTPAPQSSPKTVSMAREPVLSYLQPEEVAALLKAADRDRTLVLDVRDDDFFGGHIKGCLNLTSNRFEDDSDVDAIIKEHCVGKDRIVVHCMMSQQRGPFCANRLAERLQASDREGKPDVYVLSHGFERFGRMYSHDPDLCED